MMGWKHDLRLHDLDDATEIEIVCKRCGVTRTLRAGQIIKAQPDLAWLYCDEIEASLYCSLHHCRGGVRISILHDGKEEGWIGGLA